jgi:hypothetical protein
MHWVSFVWMVFMKVDDVRRVRLWVVVVLSGSVLACSGSPHAPVPAPSALPAPAASPPSPPPPQAGVSVRGLIAEYVADGVRPVAGLSFAVAGYANGARVSVDVTTDSNGRYEASGLPDTVYFIHARLPLSAGFLMPCAINADVHGVDVTLNFNVVSNRTIAAMGVPGVIPRTHPMLFGLVMLPAGDPVANASIELFYGTPSDNEPLATTMTDGNGAYFVCIPPPGANDQMFTVRATADGYAPASRSVVPLSDEEINLELR